MIVIDNVTRVVDLDYKYPTSAQLTIGEREIDRRANYIELSQLFMISRLSGALYKMVREPILLDGGGAK